MIAKKFQLVKPTGELIKQYNSFWEHGNEAPDKKVKLFTDEEDIDIFEIFSKHYFDSFDSNDKNIRKKIQSDATFFDALKMINGTYHTRLHIDETKMCSLKELHHMCEEEIALYNNEEASEKRNGGFDRFMQICSEATGKNAYSFATKVFSFMNGEQFPIMDKIAASLLAQYLGEERKKDWEIYRNYKQDYELFIKKFELESYNFKKIDVFLWTYGTAINNYWKMIGIFDFENISYQRPSK